MSRTRDIARIMGKTEAGNPSNASLLSGTASMTVYSTLDSLPINGLTSGDQAFVNATNRLYISNGVGWYNVALVFGVNVNTDESLVTVAMNCAESDPKLWLINNSVPSESPGSALMIRGVAESTIVYSSSGTESQKGALFTVNAL